MTQLYAMTHENSGEGQAKMIEESNPSKFEKFIKNEGWNSAFLNKLEWF